MKIITTILISTLCFATAVAQDEVLEEELVAEELRRYTVEIIVFSYEEDVSIGSEVFLPDEPLIEEDPLLDEEGLPIEADQEPVPVFTDRDDAPEEEPAPAWTVRLDEVVEEDLLDSSGDREDDRLELVLLNEEELVLGDAIRQFELLDAYKTIMHFGWTQPVYPEEDTPAIELRLFAEPPEGLNGTFTLYLSRYLHLVTDLALDAPLEVEESEDTDDAFFSFSDSRSQYDDDFELPVEPVRYRIQEHRIVKNGELRYFDHPKFGVLAKITRVEEEAEDELAIDAIADPLVSGSSE